MIVITGAAGFIGSCLAGKLNNKGFKDIVIVDDFNNSVKNKNTEFKTYRQKVDRMQFFAWLEQQDSSVDFVFHIGARTDTTEFDKQVFDTLNLNYSKQVWEYCTRPEEIKLH